MKRILSILLLLTMLLSLLPSALLTASASDTEILYPIGDEASLRFDTATGTITGRDGYFDILEIPAEIDGVAVTALGDNCFLGCVELTTLILPDSIETIGDYAFHNCNNLTDVIMGNGIKRIGRYAFAGCFYLSNITFGTGLRDIDEAAFEECRRLRKVVLLEGMESIGDKAFYRCGELEKLVLPDSVVSIGNQAFYECKKLKKLFLPENLVSIGFEAFRECKRIRCVTIPDSVTTIGWKAFSYCDNLSKVIIGRGITSLDYDVFACSAMNDAYFLGDAPAECAFHHPNVRVFYLPECSGWSSSTWNGYTAATWDGKTVPFKYFDYIWGNEWYADAVDYVYENDLMNGLTESDFGAEYSMTRAMLVTVLWRYAGEPLEGENNFSDLREDWYIDAVRWAAANGVVNGVGNNKFDPDAKVTREQMAVILYRYANILGKDTSARGDFAKFVDPDAVSDYAVEALQWAVGAGIVNGSAEGRKLYLNPQTSATRAEVAALLMRYIENVLK